MNHSVTKFIAASVLLFSFFISEAQQQFTPYDDMPGMMKLSPRQADTLPM